MLIEDMIAIGQVVLCCKPSPRTMTPADGASNWTYGLDPYTGGRTRFTVFGPGTPGRRGFEIRLQLQQAERRGIRYRSRKAWEVWTLSTNEQGNPEVCSSANARP